MSVDAALISGTAEGLCHKWDTMSRRETIISCQYGRWRGPRSEWSNAFIGRPIRMAADGRGHLTILGIG